MGTNKILLVLGMHRSGTSLLGQWLSHCGMHLGEEMLGKSASNKFGHFEDKDFLEFHRALLAYNGLDFDVAEKLSLEIPKKFEIQAEKIIASKNAGNIQWGWKEPRTCLFLSFWDDKLTEAKSLVVYRHYETVVDSLLRRDFHKYDHRRNFIARFLHKYHFKKTLNKLANHYLRVWINYNEQLINHVSGKERIEDYLWISHSDLFQESSRIICTIVQDWGFALNAEGIESVYKAKHLSKKVQFDVVYEKRHLDNAAQVLAKLDTLRTFK